MVLAGLCALGGKADGVGLAIHKHGRDRKRARGIDPRIPARGWAAVLGWSYTFGLVALSRVLFCLSSSSLILPGAIGFLPASAQSL